MQGDPPLQLQVGLLFGIELSFTLLQQLPVLLCIYGCSCVAVMRL